jgi:hypothetical protein
MQCQSENEENSFVLTNLKSIPAEDVNQERFKRLEVSQNRIQRKLNEIDQMFCKTSSLHEEGVHMNNQKLGEIFQEVGENRREMKNMEENMHARAQKLDGTYNLSKENRRIMISASENVHQHINEVEVNVVQKIGSRRNEVMSGIGTLSIGQSENKLQYEQGQIELKETLAFVHQNQKLQYENLREGIVIVMDNVNENAKKMLDRVANIENGLVHTGSENLKASKDVFEREELLHQDSVEIKENIDEKFIVLKDLMEIQEERHKEEAGRTSAKLEMLIEVGESLLNSNKKLLKMD